MNEEPETFNILSDSTDNSLGFIFKFNNIITKEICKKYIKLAEKSAKYIGWKRFKFVKYSTVDININLIPDLIDEHNKFRNDKIIPLIKKYYDLTDSIITPNKEFIIKYTENGQSELEIHRDQSVISYNILLNSEYEFTGGGTFFESNNLLIKPNQGDLLIHSGLVKHGGNKIISGTRYLLVGFLDVKSKFINPSYLSINHNLEDSYVLNLIWKPNFFNNQTIKIKNKPGYAKILDLFYEKNKVLVEYNSNKVTIEFDEISYL